MPVPDFSPGEVLTAAAMDSIGLWLVKTQTIGTGVSSVTVTDAFSADYDNYKIVINGGVASSDVNGTLQLGASNTGYYGTLIYTTYASGTYASATNNNNDKWYYAGYASTNSLQMCIDLLDPFATKHTKLVSSGWVALTASGNFTGIHQVASSYTQFTWAPSSGTLTGGTIRVYGYRN